MAPRPRADVTRAPGASVLVVDPSNEVRRALDEALRSDGHRVLVAGTGAAALAGCATAPPDVVLIEGLLPDLDGFEVCRRIRQVCDAHVLVLTARATEADKLHAFRNGADDYLVKPFSVREVQARVRAFVRRRRTDRPPSPVEHLVLGPLRLDPVGRTVTVHGRDVPLTRVEIDLLEALVRRPGSVVDRVTLLEAVWGRDWDGDTHLVEVHVSNLRRKLVRAGADGLVRTVRGAGYRVVDDDQQPGPAR